MQRAELRARGLNPDVLVMTATPIPRSLTMTIYGDLDVSVIDEMPPGRTPIETLVLGEEQRLEVKQIIAREVRAGRQVYVVYPLVEESEKMDLKDATRRYEYLRDKVFPKFSVGLVHGKMKSADKEEIMRRFVAGEIQILVSTTVIEVGVDVPNASVMVVEHAETIWSCRSFINCAGASDAARKKVIACCWLQRLKTAVASRAARNHGRNE